MSKHYKSVFDNEQELLKSLIELHLGGEYIELDPMYFKGNFYKNGVAEPKYKYDINPQVLGVTESDATNLPLSDNSVSNMILDPPFMFGGHGKQDQFYSSKTHGLLTWEQLSELYQNILKEAERILKPRTRLLRQRPSYTR
jgi:hypothetical protein